MAVEQGEETPAALANRATAVLVVTLLLVDSLHYVFARLLLPYLPPSSSSFYYMTLALVQIALFAAYRRQIDWQVLRDNLRFFLIIGFLIASATTMSFTAVVYLDPGTASLLARMGTIFALSFGIFWLKERLTPGEWLGALLAVVGVIVISFQPGDASSNLVVGTLLVLGSTFSYALHAAIVKRYGGTIDFLNFFLFRMVTTCSFLFLISLGSGDLVWPSGLEVWLILLLTATVNVSISRSVYYLVLRRVDLSIMTILLTLTPVITILWSVVLFDERPTPQSLLGGAAVILGVLLVTWSRSRK